MLKLSFLKQNVGLQSTCGKPDTFNQFKNQLLFVYSDPDILLQKDCPKDFVYQLYVLS